MDRSFIIEKIRESYRRRDVKSMKRQLAIGSWLLTDEDKSKIRQSIIDIEAGKVKPVEQVDQPVQKKESNKLIEDALKILGGRIIE